jgi:hypothetical protein
MIPSNVLTAIQALPKKSIRNLFHRFINMEFEDAMPRAPFRALNINLYLVIHKVQYHTRKTNNLQGHLFTRFLVLDTLCIIYFEGETEHAKKVRNDSNDKKLNYKVKPKIANTRNT